MPIQPAKLHQSSVSPSSSTSKPRASMSSSESVSQKRPAADDVVGVTPAKLVPAPPQESALMIPEIAEHIFRFLPARQVVELRSVCGRWKKLIDGSSRLMSRVWIKFPSGDKLVQDYRLKFLPAGANSIAVGSNEIGYVDSWWPSLAQKLAHLKVDYFGGNEHHLIRMLQHSPGLKSFHLGSIRYNLKEECTSYASLKELEQLTINSSNLTLSLICPRLKRVQSIATGAKFNQFLISVRDSVEDLTSKCTKDMLFSLVHMNRLKRLDLSLHEMSFDDFQQTLYTITEEMSELVSLKFSMHNQGVRNALKLTTLGSLAKLECLEIGATQNESSSYCKPSITFGNAANPELKELSLTGLDLAGSEIEQYSSQSTCLRKIKLHNCRLRFWQQLYSIVQPHCQWLEHLEVGGFRELNSDYGKRFFSSQTTIEDAVVERIIKECRVLKLLAIDGGVRLTASLLEIFQRGLASN